jgi:hypothetical protein
METDINRITFYRGENNRLGWSNKIRLNPPLRKEDEPLAITNNPSINTSSPFRKGRAEKGFTKL